MFVCNEASIRKHDFKSSDFKPNCRWQPGKYDRNRIGPLWSLALFGSDSATNVEAREQVDAESLSKRRLEGSRWRGGTRMEVQTSLVLFQPETGFGVRRSAGLRGPNGARIVRSRGRELPVERCKNVSRWPGTHDCDRASKHGVKPIVIGRFKKCRVARIMSRSRGQ